MKKLLTSLFSLTIALHSFAMEEYKPSDTLNVWHDLFDAAQKGKSLDKYYLNVATEKHYTQHIQTIGLALIPSLHDRCGKNSPLHILNTFIIQQITELAAIDNLTPEEKGKALIEATSIGSYDTVKTLLFFGANTENEDTNKQIRPLHAACRHGYPELVTLLLNYGADKDAKVADQEHGLGTGAPVHFAAENGNHSCLARLIEAKANVNAINSNNYSALHYAVFANSPECIKLLLSANADKTIVSAENETALEIATAENYTECMKLLS